jgi:hypothetical protein
MIKPTFRCDGFYIERTKLLKYRQNALYMLLSPSSAKVRRQLGLGPYYFVMRGHLPHPRTKPPKGTTQFNSAIDRYKTTFVGDGPTALFRPSELTQPIGPICTLIP